MNETEAFAALVKQVPGWLDRPIEDLVKMSAVGSVYVSTHRALLRKIKSGQLGLAEEDRKTKVAEGQVIGEALLDVERRIGELLPSSRDEEHGIAGVHDTRGNHGKFKRIRPEGMSSKSLHNSRAIASHPDAVAQVIQEAKDNDDIPTKTAVLNKIKLKKAEEKIDRYKKAKEKIDSEWDGIKAAAPLEVATYINSMERVLSILPKEPPADGWRDDTMAMAIGYACIIIKRLRRFIDEKTVAIAEKRRAEIGMEESDDE